MRRAPAAAAALSAVSALLSLAGCQPAQEAPPAPVRPVLYTVARSVDTALFGPFAGTVEPRYRAQLGFQIGGRVAARDVTVGDVVKKGQRLASLDPTVTRYALTRAEAEVADATAQAENAAATEGRARRLAEGGNVAQAQLDGATAARETTQARLNQARAGLQKARDQMDWTELHADFDGVVTERSAEIGQVLSAGQAVYTVARPEVREAVVDIPEDLVGAMPQDGRFAVALQSAPTITAAGRVREVAPFAEAGTRTRRIRMTLEDPLPAFRLGATITVALERRVAPHIDLPPTALVEAEGPVGGPAGGSTAVWIVAEDGRSVARRMVVVGARSAESVRIREGLRAGERVVVAGVHSLREGQAVALAENAR